MAPSSEFACRNDCRSAALSDRDSSSILEATSFSDVFKEIYCFRNNRFKDQLACNNEMHTQLSKSGAKVLHLFELSKYFCKKSVFFVKKLHICQ